MKNVVCFGDSNTFGYSGDPTEKKGRFNKEQRWTCLLQKELGAEFSIKEEGANGRTIQFEADNEPSLCGLNEISRILVTHQPVFLFVIMLGTNDTQARFSSSPEEITSGLKKLIEKIRLEATFNEGEILVIAPPSMQMGLYNGPFSSLMGKNSVEKSKILPPLYEKLAQEEGCLFLDSNTTDIMENGINQVDFLHLNQYGHKSLSKILSLTIQNSFK